MSFVTGAGPVSFNDPTSGAQFMIPLTKLRFDDSSGKLIASDWPGYGALSLDNRDLLDNWLAYLVKSGSLAPSTRPAPSTAAVITAKQPGANGNSIAIVISDVTATAFKARVTETDTYKDLDLATVEAALNSSPGLVRVKSGSPGTEPPKATPPSIPLANGGANAKAKADIPATSSTAFTLQAKAVGLDGNATKIDIIVSDPSTAKFDLVATWTREKADCTPQEFKTEFAYVIDVVLPGTTPPLPAAGTYMLRGGAEPGPALPASTILLTA